MLVGRDIPTVHGERWIAITDFKIPEHLVIGTVLFDDVDHVTYWISASRERYPTGIGAEEIVLRDLLRQISEIVFCLGNIQTGDGATNQGADVGMLAMPALILQPVDAIVGPTALPLGRGDEQIITRGGERTGIPLGRNEAEGVVGLIVAEYASRRKIGSIEDRDSVQ